MQKRTDDYALNYMGLKLTQGDLDTLQAKALSHYTAKAISGPAANVCAAIDMLIALGYIQPVQDQTGATMLAVIKR